MVGPVVVAGQELVLKALGKKTGIHENNLRRWAGYFGEFLPSRKVGRATKYDPQCADVFRRIQSLYNSGLSTDGVRERLADELKITIEVTQEEPQDVLASLPMPIGLERVLEPFLSTWARQTGVLERQVAAFEKHTASLERIVEQQAEMLTLLRQQLAGQDKAKDQPKRVMEHEKILALVAELDAARKTRREIARRLNEQGIATVSGRGAWSHSAVCRLLDEMGKQA